MTLSLAMKQVGATLTLVLFVLFFPSAVRSQTRTFTNESRGYSLELPSSEWSVIPVTGVAHDSTELRYNGEAPVRMRIRRDLVDAGVTPADLVWRRQRSDRGSLNGYVKGKEENFEGHLNGAKFFFEYVRGGQPKARLIYYLHADSHTIYRLEFTGPPIVLSALEDETDSIARSFQLN